MKDFSIKILKQGEIVKHSVEVQMKVPWERSEKIYFATTFFRSA